MPTGIGNNGGGFDIGILQGDSTFGGDGYAPDDSSSDGLGLGDGLDMAGEEEEEEVEEEEEINTTRKRKRKDDVDAEEDKKFSGGIMTKKSKGPREGKSTLLTTLPKKGKTLAGIDRFADIAAREEETTQKVLELKKTKFESERDKSVAKVKAKADIQMNKDKLRAELAQKKLELEYQFKLQMAQMSSGSARSGLALHDHSASHSNTTPNYSWTGWDSAQTQSYRQSGSESSDQAGTAAAGLFTHQLNNDCIDDSGDLYIL